MFVCGCGCACAFCLATSFSSLPPSPLSLMPVRGTRVEESQHPNAADGITPDMQRLFVSPSVQRE